MKNPATRCGVLHVEIEGIARFFQWKINKINNKDIIGYTHSAVRFSQYVLKIFYLVICSVKYARVGKTVYDVFLFSQFIQPFNRK